jgi:hypothetical protein
MLFAIFLINGLIYIPAQSITADEGDHYNYAVRFAKGHPEKVRPFDDASTMPLSVVSTIPRIFEQVVHPNIKKTDNGRSDVIHGRYLTLIVCLFIGLIVYRWSRALYGEKGGLFSLFFFAFCPNISAHASLVTTDAYSALFTVLPAYYFWKYFRSTTVADFFWFAFWLSVAQLAKQSLTWLYPIFLLLGLFAILGGARPIKDLRRFTLLSFVFLITTIFVLNVGFQFNQTGRSLHAYEFKSRFFSSLANNSGFLGEIPLPLPTPYLQGLDYTKNMDEMGGGHPESSEKIYLLGESRTGKGFPYYYLVTGFFKTPLPLLIAILAAIVLLFRNGSAAFRSKELFVVFPVLCFLVYFNLFYRSQVGLRHILMIFPLLFVLAGNLANIPLRKQWYIAVILGLATWSIADFYYFFPHLIPFTNEFVPRKKMAYRIMADSNLDYEQATAYRDRYLTEHPEIKYAPSRPTAGRFLIRLSDLLDLKNEGQYQWLRANFEPADHLVFTYLIFNISEKNLKQRHLR